MFSVAPVVTVYTRLGPVTLSDVVEAFFRGRGRGRTAEAKAVEAGNEAR